MHNIRIIPRLDIKGSNLVKGIHLEGLRVLGKPEHFARYYYEHGADELLYMDVVASLYGRNNLHDIVRKTAKEIFIPLTVGGGIRTLEDIRGVLRAGADKVAINTAAIKNPNLIETAAQRFGSSTIVVSIEAMKKSDVTYEAYTDNGREATGLDAVVWARTVEKLGAGEIMITSINQEGTGNGFDIELVRQVSDSVSIPVIACGGAGKPEHMAQVVRDGRADAVCVASILHYDYIRHHPIEENLFEEGNIEFVKKGRGFSKINPFTLDEVKRFLNQEGIPCRLEENYHRAAI